MRNTRTLALSMIVAFAALGAAEEAAEARPRPAGRIKGKRFEANKTFGLGLELGSPAGLTAKYFLSDSNALQFGLGWYNGYYRDNFGLHVYGDYLWHPVSLVSASAFELPLFVGVGLHFNNFEDRRDRDRYYDAYGFGIRVPVGIAFDFNEVPLDIFLQLVPSINFYNGYRDDFGLWVDFSIGIRYWFD